VHFDALLSNVRLRGTGFRFDFSTNEQGLQEVVDSLRG
jgi:hypothetical protein